MIIKVQIPLIEKCGIGEVTVNILIEQEVIMIK
jgi:hypothetical protein